MCTCTYIHWSNVHWVCCKSGLTWLIDMLNKNEPVGLVYILWANYVFCFQFQFAEIPHIVATCTCMEGVHVILRELNLVVFKGFMLSLFNCNQVTNCFVRIHSPCNTLEISLLKTCWCSVNKIGWKAILDQFFLCKIKTIFGVIFHFPVSSHFSENRLFLMYCLK